MVSYDTHNKLFNPETRNAARIHLVTRCTILTLFIKPPVVYDTIFFSNMDTQDFVHRPKPAFF